MGEHTLSFCLLNDLNKEISLEWRFKDFSELQGILEKLWNEFLSGVHYDCSGYFFEQKSKAKDINTVLEALKKNDYYVLNRWQRYYVVAFAINYTRFYVWSKDCDAELIEWSQNGPIVDNYDSDHETNPVVRLLRNI